MSDKTAAPIKTVPSIARPRLHCLDSIRGLASLAVLMFHCCWIYPQAVREHIFFLAKFTPFAIFTNGHAAVIIFFVLSGYVLSLPFFGNRPVPFKQYLVKRFCRIYLPFAAAVCVSTLLWLISSRVPVSTLSAWFQGNWPPPPLEWRRILSHFLMEGTNYATHLDGPIWSLTHEIRISIMFPALIFISRKSARAIALGLFLFFASTVLLELCGDGNINVIPDSSLATWLLTLRYVPFFLMGILVSKHSAMLGSTIRKMPWWLYGLFWACSYAAICKHIRSDWVLAHFGDLFIALGSAGLIVLCLHSPRVSHFLEKGPAQWLGQVSYSLYLIHVPIMLFVGYQFGAAVGVTATVAIAIATSLVIAQFMFQFVEQPSIAFGKWLVSRSASARVA